MTTRFTGVEAGDVLSISPADGWVAVYADPHSPDGMFVNPLLLWAVIVDEDGNRGVDAFDEPSQDDGPHPFLWPVTQNGSFVCFARASEVDDDRERFVTLARSQGKHRREE